MLESETGSKENTNRVDKQVKWSPSWRARDLSADNL